MLKFTFQGLCLKAPSYSISNSQIGLNIPAVLSMRALWFTTTFMPTAISSVTSKCEMNASPWQPPCLSSMSIHFTALRLPVHDAFGMEPGTPEILIKKKSRNENQERRVSISLINLPSHVYFVSVDYISHQIFHYWYKTLKAYGVKLVVINLALLPVKRNLFFYSV